MNLLLVFSLACGIGGFLALVFMSAVGVFLSDADRKMKNILDLANQKVEELEKDEELKKQREAEFVMGILDERRKKEQHRSIYDPVEKPW